MSTDGELIPPTLPAIARPAIDDTAIDDTAIAEAAIEEWYAEADVEISGILERALHTAGTIEGVMSEAREILGAAAGVLTDARTEGARIRDEADAAAIRVRREADEGRDRVVTLAAEEAARLRAEGRRVLSEAFDRAAQHDVGVVGRRPRADGAADADRFGLVAEEAADGAVVTLDVPDDLSGLGAASSLRRTVRPGADPGPGAGSGLGAGRRWLRWLRRR